MACKYPVYQAVKVTPVYWENGDPTMKKMPIEVRYLVMTKRERKGKWMPCCNDSAALFFESRKLALAEIARLKEEDAKRFAAVEERPRFDRQKFNGMSKQERAEYLLSIGVTAKIDLNKDSMCFDFIAYVVGAGSLPCGYHASEQAAIDAGTQWLREMAAPPVDFKAEYNGKGGVRFDIKNPPAAGTELKTIGGEVVVFDEIGLAGMLACTRKSDGMQQLYFPHDIFVANVDLTGAAPLCGAASSDRRERG